MSYSNRPAITYVYESEREKESQRVCIYFEIDKNIQYKYINGLRLIYSESIYGINNLKSAHIDDLKNILIALKLELADYFRHKLCLLICLFVLTQSTGTISFDQA
ncbi:hypothetical protein BpHYR1_023131 [Brachionus plicatilis]|uniref:Uncharacterized protein n=1 Tax=Brachionus plicatilis TaxID=10195 RepID=A0A3M7QGV9_BRAPC|nr:hypothetical protein BpHYR1_023131 [Brachionus plicatilis]